MEPTPEGISFSRANRARFDTMHTIRSLGQIQAPEYLWSALTGVTSSNFIRQGELSICSAEIRGGIRIFCNRYITAAHVYTTGATGIAALKMLLSLRSGVFTFGPCETADDPKAALDLSIDILELQGMRSIAVSDTVSPVSILNNLLAPEPCSGFSPVQLRQLGIFDSTLSCDSHPAFEPYVAPPAFHMQFEPPVLMPEIIVKGPETAPKKGGAARHLMHLAQKFWPRKR